MCWLIFSCGRESNNAGASDFFDVGAFFNSELSRLGDTVRVIKVVYRNDEQIDSVLLENYDLRTDFTEFSKSDINKPALSDDYAIDTLMNRETKTIRYTTISDTNPTKSVLVSSMAGEVETISIHRKYESLISDLEQYIVYQSGGVYEVQSTIVDNVTNKTMQVRIRVYIDISD